MRHRAPGTGTDRLTAVGDEGVLLEARLALDRAERLVGIADACVTLLVRCFSRIG